MGREGYFLYASFPLAKYLEGMDKQKWNKLYNKNQNFSILETRARGNLNKEILKRGDEEIVSSSDSSGNLKTMRKEKR